jgi:hypothetical protein
MAKIALNEQQVSKQKEELHSISTRTSWNLIAIEKKVIKTLAF